MTPILPSKSLFSLLLLALLFALLPASSHAAGVLDAITDEVNDVYEKASPSVVRIGTPELVQPYASGYGSGFFIDSNGTILTSYTVVGEAYQAYVEYKNKRYDALVLSRDRRSGVALLRIETSSTPYLKFADSNALKLTSALVAIGYPFNMPSTPGFGLVEGFDVQYQNSFFATTHIRAKIPVSIGQVGGPILNPKGELVGMIVVPIDDGKALYAIPSNAAKKIIDDMFKYGTPRHGWTGVGVVERKDPESVGGDVFVSQIYQDTPASRSGIMVGDKVVKIGGREIKKPSDILDAAFFAKVGEKIPVIVQRSGKIVNYEIEVRERPASSRMVEPVRMPASSPAPANPILKPSTDPIRVDQKQ